MATPKSTKERLARHVRPRKVSPRSHNFVGKCAVKKTGNNDPHRSGNPYLHNQLGEDFKKTIIFLAEHIGKTDAEMKKAISEFKHRDVIRDILNHMIAVRLGGWRRDSGNFVNESGRQASPKNWTLREDGHLLCKNKQPVLFDVDWLVELLGSCE